MPKIELSFETIKELVKPEKMSGSFDETITHISALADAQAGDISFLGNKKYKSKVSNSKASVIIVPSDFEGNPGEKQTFLYHQQPSRALDLICGHLEEQFSLVQDYGIHPSAVIHDSVKLPDDVYIGAFVMIEEGCNIGSGTRIDTHSYIGKNATLGKNCDLRPRSSVMHHCVIGNRCTLHPGAVVGSDGFGYETVNGQHLKSPQIGIAVLEDDVDIGTNTSIDRARFGETFIGQGTKIDNLVQVGHNVKVGKGCFFASGTGISGSTIVGDYVFMGGKVGISGHLKIGSFSKIAGTTAVYQDLEDNSFVRGDPAIPYMQAQKYFVLRKKIPELFRRVSELEKKS